MLTLDLSHVNAGLKKAKVEPVVGVLGADVLWRHHAVIDYDRGLMLLSAFDIPVPSRGLRRDRMN